MDIIGSETSTENHVKVWIPDFLEDKKLYSVDGKVFTVNITDNLIFKKRFLQEDGSTWTGIDDQILKEVIDVKALRTEKNNHLRNFLNAGISALDPLIKSVSSGLRKNLIESSSGHLRLLFQDFFYKNSKHIAEIFGPEKTDGVVNSTGILPKLTRFRWEMKKGNNKFSIYCLELSPHKRHLTMRKQSEDEGRSYNWVMPWLCILVSFKNDNFLKLTAFYRNQQLDAEDNSLMKCGLPGKSNESPWNYCDRGYTPYIRLSDPAWVDKLLTWFFDSTFMYHNYQTDGYDVEYRDICRSVSEMKSFSDWARFSDSPDALERVCQINFPLTDINLRETVLETMRYLSKESVGESAEVVKEKEFSNLADKFEQSAREKFVFLVSKTSIDTGTQEKIKLLLTEALEVFKTSLQRSLDRRIRGLGLLVKQILINRIEESEDENKGEVQNANFSSMV